MEWIRGDYGIADATLNRFFALHVVAVPLVLLLLVALHLVALRQVGSNNPDGIEIKENTGADGKPLDGIPFHPYYTVKDIVGVGVFLIAVRGRGVLRADLRRAVPGGRRTSSRPIRCRRREHIAPVVVLHAVLRDPARRARPAAGRAADGCVAVLAFFFLPWLDRSPVKSMRYRGWMFKRLPGGVHRVVPGAGVPRACKPATGAVRDRWRASSRRGYFAFFLLMPFYTRWRSHQPVPQRVTFHD